MKERAHSYANKTLFAKTGGWAAVYIFCCGCFLSFFFKIYLLCVALICCFVPLNFPVGVGVNRHGVKAQTPEDRLGKQVQVILGRGKPCYILSTRPGEGKQPHW